jgi:hypothetical protein
MPEAKSRLSESGVASMPEATLQTRQNQRFLTVERPAISMNPACLKLRRDVLNCRFLAPFVAGWFPGPSGAPA